WIRQRNHYNLNMKRYRNISMNDLDVKIIKPNNNKPIFVTRTLLYHQNRANVTNDIPRALCKPRRRIVPLLVDGCTGKICSSDSWPQFMKSLEGKEDQNPSKISMEEAREHIFEYATKKIARRYLTYWKPVIEVNTLSYVYKLFWMTRSKSVVDSLSANEL